MDPLTTNISCKFINSQFNGTTSPDICDIVVFAGGGVLILLLFLCILLFGIFCCSKRSRRRNHQGTVQRTKPLVTTQATSWFTNSLTMPTITKKDQPENSNNQASNPNAKKKGKIEQDGRGHVYQTLQLDELDYESMYTRTVPSKKGKGVDIIE